MDAIVCTTNTGSTERYAKLLSDKTGLSAYPMSEAKQRIRAGADIIYLGWISAGTVKVILRRQNGTMCVLSAV